MGLRTRRRLKGSTITSTVLMHFARSTPRLVIALSPVFFGSYSKAISAPCRKAENWCSNSVTPTSHTSFTLTETQIIHKHETFFLNCPALCLILSYFGKVTEPNFAAVSHRSNVTDIHTHYKKKNCRCRTFLTCQHTEEHCTFRFYWWFIAFTMIKKNLSLSLY